MSGKGNIPQRGSNQIKKKIWESFRGSESRNPNGGGGGGGGVGGGGGGGGGANGNSGTKENDRLRYGEDDSSAS